MIGSKSYDPPGNPPAMLAMGKHPVVGASISPSPRPSPPGRGGILGWARGNPTRTNLPYRGTCFSLSLGERAWSLDIFREEIPKGLRPKAQGCDLGATLGNRWSMSQPQRGCVSILRLDSIPNRHGVWAEAPGRNPVGVVRLFGHFTQGSSRFAEIGRASCRERVCYAV